MAEKLPQLFREILKIRDTEDVQRSEERLWKKYGSTCAVLVLDSTGFTRTARARGIVYFLHVFLRMRQIVGPLLERYKCLAWRSEADNLFAEFADPDRALAAALAAHLAVKKARLMLSDEEPYRVCIGIGYGRVLEGGRHGMFGDEMNLACKLGEDVAEGGETLLTERAYKALKRRKGTRFEKREVVVSGNTIPYFSARR
jgi:class 3 adenylate cyclase